MNELKLARDQYVLIQTQLELEEEAITNKLMKRMGVLQREKKEVRGQLRGRTCTEHGPVDLLYSRGAFSFASLWSALMVPLYLF